MEEKPIQLEEGAATYSYTMNEEDKKKYITRTKDYIQIDSDPIFFGIDPNLIGIVKTETIWTVYKKNSEANPDFEILGTREYDSQNKKFTEYKFITHKELKNLVEVTASGLAELGLKKGEFVVGCYNNRKEWIASDLGIWRQAACCLPLRTGIDFTYYQKIIELAEPTFAIINPDKVHDFIDMCESMSKGGIKISIKCFIVLSYPNGPNFGKESLPEEYIKRFQALNIKIIKWDELQKIGKEHPHPEAEQKPGNLHSLIFTSGTTSNNLKGVLLSQQAMVTAATHGFFYCKEKNSRYFSVINNQHISERESISARLSIGKVKIGFASDGYKNFLEDCEKFGPREMPVSPLLLKIFKNLNQKFVESGLTEEKANELLRKKLGGNFKYMIAYGAPSARELIQWGIRTLQVEIANGYGTTETGGTATGTSLCFIQPRNNSVGYPCCHTTIRLIDCPECGCKITDEIPKGEILIKSPGMMGYFKNPQLNKECFDEDGYYHSSDLAQLEDDGSLTFLGRKNYVIKVASLGYVPLETIEDYHLTSPLISSSIVYGDSQDFFLVTVIVPNFNSLANDSRCPKELKEKCIYAGSHPESKEAEEFCKNSLIEKIYLDEAKEIGKKFHFPMHWNVEGVILDPITWTEQNGMITFSKKMKRFSIIEHFKSKIDDKKAEIRKTFKFEV